MISVLQYVKLIYRYRTIVQKTLNNNYDTPTNIVADNIKSSRPKIDFSVLSCTFTATVGQYVQKVD